MERREDWAEQLQRVVRQYQNEPWIWGETDCAHFAAACVAAMTGADILGTFRNNYTSRLSCAARLRAKGFRTVEAWAITTFSAMKWPEGVPECSQVGDVGITADGVMCVRLASGFVARTEDGRFANVRPVRSWCVAWKGA